MREVLRSVRAGGLLRLYGALLTDKQRETAELYFDTDQSLAEIAEQSGVSRQTVKDAVASALQKLEAFESALRLLEKQKLLRRISDEGESSAEGCRQRELFQSLKDIL